MNRTRKLFTLATLAAALAACSSMPERNAALEQARNRYNAAQADPQITALASDELQRAASSLRVADQAQKEGKSLANVDHLAYLTLQRVNIAQDSAASRAAEAVTTSAAAERDKMRLALRTNEADTALAQLAQSKKDSAQQSNALASADANAQRDQARLARREARMHELEAQLSEMHAKKTERGMVITLGDTLFDSGSSTLGATGTLNMSKLAEFFKRNPLRRATVEGFTDSMGSLGANQALSERRAQAVVTALVAQGVPADRLNMRAYGEEQPVASNATAAGRQLNRRVEILFAPQDDDVSLK